MKTRPRLPVAGPWITEKEIAYVTDAVTNAWYEQANMYNERFEKAFTAWLGRRYALSLPSCTSALHLALLALDIGPGDEVIVPDATWIASAAPIAYVGATTVFADIDPRSWCLDVDAFEALITPRTRAVIPVDLYGGMPDYDRLLDVATRHGVHVIEDAAEAHGTTYRGRRSGSFGTFSAFSFHGSKTMTTGEGGMLVTDEQALVERCSVLRDHGRRPGDRWFWNGEVAFKYKMSSLQAALGLAQLERVDELIARKRQIFRWYAERLGTVPTVALNPEPPGVFNSYWMVTILLAPELGIDKQALMSQLEADGIDSRPFFHPLSSIPAYREHDEARDARRRNLHAYSIAARGVNLPSGYNLSEADVDRVCASVIAMIERP